jgi:CRISPR-associated protein Cas2
MVVMILEKVPTSLRGELSRWMVEPRTGVFVGRVSALVRDKLWEKAQQGAKGGAGMLLHTAQTEQGFRALSFGDPSRHLVDLEGLTLVRRPHKERRPTKTE